MLIMRTNRVTAVRSGVEHGALPERVIDRALAASAGAGAAIATVRPQVQD